MKVLRDKGYFLAGLLPYWFGADGLLMQKVRLEPDWDAIQGADQRAAVLRDMVREEFERPARRKKVCRICPETTTDAQAANQ